jgi:hypothetical protein
MCDMTNLFSEILRSLIGKADILESKLNSLHSAMLSIYVVKLVKSSICSRKCNDYNYTTLITMHYCPNHHFNYLNKSMDDFVYLHLILVISKKVVSSDTN